VKIRKGSSEVSPTIQLVHKSSVERSSDAEGIEMTGETIKVFLLLFMFGVLEAALILPEMQLKQLWVRSRRDRAKN
jgi:hypothetical protein